MALTVLDAGVLIGALDAADPHHAAVVNKLRSLLDGGDELVAPASVYAEVLVGPFRSGPHAVATAEEFIDALAIHVEPASREIARLAAQLRAQHGGTLRLPDALVVATGQALGADRVVTTDRRWPRRLPIRVELT